MSSNLMAILSGLRSRNKNPLLCISSKAEIKLSPISQIVCLSNLWSQKENKVFNVGPNRLSIRILLSETFEKYKYFGK